MSEWSWKAKLLSGRYFMSCAVIVTVCYCSATQTPVSNELWVIAAMIGTHYFDKAQAKVTTKGCETDDVQHIGV